MKTQPSISAVIPCYNDGIYLTEAIASVKAQTFKPLEIIVVNDGSTEPATLEILNDIPDNLVQVLHKRNGKAPAARNYGIQHARGEIIASLDADDHFHPSFFEKALKVLWARPKTGLITSQVQLFGEKNGLKRPLEGNGSSFLFPGAYCPASAIFRRVCWEEAGGFDEAMTMGYEDWEFYISVTRKGWQVHVIQERMLFSRQTKRTVEHQQAMPKWELIDYVVNKHSGWYLDRLKEMMLRNQVFYSGNRVSYRNILKMVLQRLRGKHK
jgi:glycosyltransferase involved in cell wall biosynthesis